LTVFTTRPDTVFGATYMVLAPEHPLVDTPRPRSSAPPCVPYQRQAAAKDVVARRVGDKTKTGVFLGSYARNPATGEAIPLWIADYVLMEYGTGAIMARAGARPPRLRIRAAVQAADPGGRARAGRRLAALHRRRGKLVNSGQFDGLGWRDGAARIVAWLQQKRRGRPQVQFRLHDWCIFAPALLGPPIR